MSRSADVSESLSTDCLWCLRTDRFAAPGRQRPAIHPDSEHKHAPSANAGRGTHARTFVGSFVGPPA